MAKTRWCKYSTHRDWRTLWESLRKFLKYFIFVQRLTNNLANAQMGIPTTHSGPQLAQNSLFDILLQYPSAAMIGDFLTTIHTRLLGKHLRTVLFLVWTVNSTAITNEKITLTWHIASSISRPSRAIFEFQTLIHLSEMNNNLLINLQKFVQTAMCRKHVNPHFFGRKLQRFPHLSLIVRVY